MADRDRGAALLGTVVYSAPMARKFVVFLLTVVALQFSWVAISVYCGHESGRTAQHFGHHPHSGHADDTGLAKEKSSTLAKQLAPHADCSSCSHASLAPATVDTVLAHASPGLRLHAMPLSAPASVYAAPPERPQWPAHA